MTLLHKLPERMTLCNRQESALKMTRGRIERHGVCEGGRVECRDMSGWDGGRQGDNAGLCDRRSVATGIQEVALSCVAPS